MKRVGAQDYEVVRADFPLKVEVEGFDQAVFLAAPSKVDVRLPDLTPVTTFDLDFKEISGQRLGTGLIPDPGNPATPPQKQYAPPKDIFFTFTLGYPTPNGPDPRYEIRLLAASGDKDTRIRRPNQSITITTRLDYD